MVAVTCSPDGEAEVEAWREEQHLHADPVAAEPGAQPADMQAVADVTEAEVSYTQHVSVIVSPSLLLVCSEKLTLPRRCIFWRGFEKA